MHAVIQTHNDKDSLCHLLTNTDLEDGQESEGCSHDGQNAGADEKPATEQSLAERDGDLGDVDQRANPGRDQPRGDRVLLQVDAGEADREPEYDVRDRNESAHHGERVLQSHEGGHQVRDLLIYYR